jgi:hypothetical protein
MAGFAYVRIWKGSSSCMTWVENKPTTILPFQANVDRCWRRHEVVPTENQKSVWSVLLD